MASKLPQSSRMLKWVSFMITGSVMLACGMSDATPSSQGRSPSPTLWKSRTSISAPPTLYGPELPMPSRHSQSLRNAYCDTIARKCLTALCSRSPGFVPSASASNTCVVRSGSSCARRPASLA